MHDSASLHQNPSSPSYHQLQIDVKQRQQVDLTGLLLLKYMAKRNKSDSVKLS